MYTLIRKSIVNVLYFLEGTGSANQQRRPT